MTDIPAFPSVFPRTQKDTEEEESRGLPAPGGRGLLKVGKGAPKSEADQLPRHQPTAREKETKREEGRGPFHLVVSLHYSDRGREAREERNMERWWQARATELTCEARADVGKVMERIHGGRSQCWRRYDRLLLVLLLVATLGNGLLLKLTIWTPSTDLKLDDVPDQMDAEPAVPVPSAPASVAVNAAKETDPSVNSTQSNVGHHNYIPPCELLPNPVPMILMSLGRSGTASMFEVMSRMSGNGQTMRIIELTGSSTRASEKIFDEMDDDTNGEWMVDYLCKQQRRYPNAGLVAFKWKPFETIFGEKSRRSLDLLSRLDDPQIKVVRSRRNLLDVFISRHKHGQSNKKRGKGGLAAHCRKSDVVCLQRQLEAGSRLELPTGRLVDQLRELHDMEARTDNLLRELNVPSVHVSFEKLFGADESTDEWRQVFSHLGIAVHNLAAERIEQAAHAATSLPHHNATLANYNEVRQTLLGTEFETLLH